MTPSAVKFGRYFILAVNDEKEAITLWPARGGNIADIRSLYTFVKNSSARFLLVIDSQKDVICEGKAIKQMLGLAAKKNTGLVFSDFSEKKRNKLTPHPLIYYQAGSIRDDFDFGYFFVFSVEAIISVAGKYGTPPANANTCLYDLRLKLSLDYRILRIPQVLYTVADKKIKYVKKKIIKAEKHFAYAAADNLARQKQLEKVVTNYLRLCGAYLKMPQKKTHVAKNNSPVEASVVIPVLNRKNTITDALKSALAQKTGFDFNIIVVDNHSTDGTTKLVKSLAAENEKIKHIIPNRRDLGIGGCWNEAVKSRHCGRFAVQLDSDDLYSSTKTLQKIVDVLRRGKFALAVGSYTVVNKRLEKIAPGLVDHKEWSKKNGHNNLLRVNGLGAPRAFHSAVIRKIGFPNVSYGEDYAVALRISREYTIGRIYQSLYLCRRWQGNTDSALSIEQKNLNDYYKDRLRTKEIKKRITLNKKNRDLDKMVFSRWPNRQSLAYLCLNLIEKQKESWPRLADAYHDLNDVRTRLINCGRYNVTLQFNPKRAASSGAAVDAETIKSRQCFLCPDNLPVEQKAILYRDKYLILGNPAPVFKNHFTVAHIRHQPQTIASSFGDLLMLAKDLSPDFIVFYNGPACGASAPDHLHFQVIPKKTLPFIKELCAVNPDKQIAGFKYYSGRRLGRSILVLSESKTDILAARFKHLTHLWQKVLAIQTEPMMNVLCTYEDKAWRLIIFLRQKHRPDDYFFEGDKKIFVSPGAIDMAGVIITPMEIDFMRLNAEITTKIYNEVSLSDNILNEILRRF